MIHLLIMQFLCFLGFSFCPKSPGSLGGFLQRLWSLAIIFVTTFAFYCCDPFNGTYYISTLQAQPFATILYGYNSKFNFLFAYFFISSYYFAFGKRISDLLICSPHCSAIFDRGRNSKWTFTFGLLLLQAFFVISYYCLADYRPEISRYQLALNWVAMYVNFISQLVPPGIAWIASWTTCKMLDSVQEKIKTEKKENNNKFNLNLTIAEVQQILKFNQAVHRLNAAPLLAFIISNAVDTLSSLCLCGLFSQYTFFIYTGMIFVFQIYLAILSRKSCQLLGMISEQKMINQELKNSNALVDNERWSYFKHDSSLAFQEYSNFFKQNSLSKPTFTKHLEGLYWVYEPLCQINIYSFFALNLSFMFTLLLFLLNYTVLIVQTSRTNIL